MINLIGNLSSDVLREAAEIRDQIDALQAQLEAVLRDGSAVSVQKNKGGKKKVAKQKAAKKKAKRKMSKEGVERIRAAQKARWAKQRKAKPKKK